MLRSLIISAGLAALAAPAGCKQEGGADPAEVETSGPTKGSAGGFSASLSAELGGSGSAGAEAAGSGLERTASGNAPKAEDSKTGSASSDAAKTDTAKTDAAKSDATKSGSATAPASAGSGVAVAAKTEPAKTEPAKTEPAKPEPAKTEPPKAGSGAGSAVAAKTEPAKTEPAKTGSGTGSAVAMVVKPAVVMTPELRAIKLSLEPNWDRDVVEPGTISLFEKNSNTTFKFRYGYEDPKAPADRDAYKKYLADNKILVAKTDRQAGAAWYLEGTDGNGRGAFRIIVMYGGKRLICHGSTYKDSGLGDLRDSVLVQAKKICETIQL